MADEHGFLIVLPQTAHQTGIDAQWAVAHNRSENEAKTDALSGLGLDSFAAANWPFGDADANFIMAVVNTVAASHELDETMIFAAGLQNGGLMAARLICDHPDRFAALAEIAYGPFMVQGCSETRPVASFSVLTDQQPTYPLALGEGTPQTGPSTTDATVSTSVDNSLPTWRSWRTRAVRQTRMLFSMSCRALAIRGRGPRPFRACASGTTGWQRHCGSS